MSDEVLSVTLALHALVKIDPSTGEVKHVDIKEGQLGQLERMSNGTPAVALAERERRAAMIVANANVLTRHILQAASVNAMPKGSEVEIVEQHLEECASGAVIAAGCNRCDGTGLANLSDEDDGLCPSCAAPTVAAETAKCQICGTTDCDPVISCGSVTGMIAGADSTRN